MASRNDPAPASFVFVTVVLHEVAGAAAAGVARLNNDAALIVMDENSRRNVEWDFIKMPGS
jgi:hypothetical protein